MTNALVILSEAKNLINLIQKKDVSPSAQHDKCPRHSERSEESY